MVVKQATIEQEELQWNQMPDNWSQTVKLDYQNKTNGLNGVAEVANEANRTASDEANRNADQDKAIELNRKNILETSSKVSVLSQSVTKNTAAIGENKQAIKTNASNLKTHEELNSAHGVTGDNVGNEDFAQELVGGVVLIAANLAELTHSFSSLTAAPADYDQTYMQSVADAVNSLGSQQGDIINLLNEVLRGQKDAKQMQPDAPVGR